MKVLYISNHFALPSQPGAPRPWKVAQYLGRQGHSVFVVVNHRHYLDERINVGSPDWQYPEIVDGVNIIGVKTTSGRRKTLGRRLINYFSYSLGALRVGLKLGPMDLIIVGTPPLLAPIAGIMLGKLWRKFIVLEVRDLHPEKAVALGLVGNRVVTTLWAGYEHIVRKLSHHVVAVEPSTRQALLKKRFPKNRITVIPNGIDRELLQSVPIPEEIEKVFLKYENWTTITYGGGMGYGNYLMPIIKSAALIQNKKIVLLFFGEGELKSTYQEYVSKEGLDNVRFFSLQTRKVINEVFKRSDILVYSAHRNPFFAGLLTNKIFEYHGAGKPIVFSGEGKMADMIRTGKSGIVVPPEDIRAIADAFCYLSGHPKTADKMGKSGKSYILRCYNRDKTFQKWNRLIELAANHSGAGK